MTNKLKNKRGFSLVELMVVVAIMGTLASIAIPAFNEYRKTAKRATYRADLTSLHKSWLAFGVELDSFCERETRPREASIQNIGMASLLGSKLYGTEGCTDGGQSTQSACTGSWNHDPSTDPMGTITPDVARIWNNGAGGKDNFIGFGVQSCGTSIPITNVQVKGMTTTADTDCDLNAGTYEMGVYGHISGANYYGVSINNNGVISGETEDDQSIAIADSSCA